MFEQNFGGDPNYMNNQKLFDLFAPSGSQTLVELVFLSACYSEKAGTELSRVVKHVIVIRDKRTVSDDISQKFAFQLYFALFSGRTV